MNVNRGKQFEGVIKDCFNKVDGVSIDRLHDQTNGFAGSANICDFIVYKKPYELYLECKSCHGNTFPLSNITDRQFNGLLEKSKIKGVVGGVIVWWVDRDVTKFFDINFIEQFKKENKSIRFDYDSGITLLGKKKRVFFDYDMKSFLEELHESINRGQD